MSIIPIALAFLWLRTGEIDTTTISSTTFSTTSNDNILPTPEPITHETCFENDPFTFKELGIGYNLIQMWWSESQIDSCLVDINIIPAIKRLKIESYENTSFSIPTLERCDQLDVTIHGFASSQSTNYMVTLKDALMKYRLYRPLSTGRCHEVICILLVDWKKGAALSTDILYWQQAVNTKPVGENLALLLLKLRQLNKIELRETHLIGFSLGAQVAHMAAEKLRSERAGNNVTSDDWHLKRITGLDPAACCFANTSNCLNAKDATYVDVIHTTGNTEPCDISQIMTVELGVSSPIGHSDFYLANASNYCRGVFCAHNFAVRVFIDSLEPGMSLKFFLSIPCDVHLAEGKLQAGCKERWLRATLNPEEDSVFGILAAPKTYNRTFYALYPGFDWLSHEGKCQWEKTYFLRPENCEVWGKMKRKW